jgi:hypothetical protein
LNSSLRHKWILFLGSAISTGLLSPVRGLAVRKQATNKALTTMDDGTVGSTKPLSPTLFHELNTGATSGADTLETTVSSSPHQFCTRAATGCSPVYQEIYTCRTCCENEPNTNTTSLCVCSACVDHCHVNHDIDYVGMGPCFCDCVDFCCKIVDESIVEAKRLGIEMTMDNTPRFQLMPLAPKQRHNDANTLSSYTQDVYHISMLRNTILRNRLILQAKELIQHSRETFWLDAETTETLTNSSSSSKLCELEYLAWHIFRRHVAHYFGEYQSDSKDGSATNSIMGAEWWVQVKPISTAPVVTPNAKEFDAFENDSDSIEAIDLHYDKDEEMADSFGLGIFPSLSTVTYLTESENVPPTIVFSRRYDEDSENIANMFINHPATTKHIVFDGRLLHGAPSHVLLRQQMPNQMKNISDDEVVTGNEDPIAPTMRITLLVNIWLNHKPYCVNVLPNPIREAIVKATIGGDEATIFPAIDRPMEFILAAPAPKLDLTSVIDQPELLRQKIELPFIGGRATWGDDDISNAMVITTYPPPTHDDYDTILVNFGPGLEASFQYTGCDDNDNKSTGME